MPRFYDLPLERKLTAIVVATTMVGMLLASVAIVAYQILTFTTFMIAELETTAEILGHNGTAALRFEASRDAEKTLASLSAKPHITGACFLTPTEDIFAVYARNESKPPQPNSPLSEGYIFGWQQLKWVKHIYQDGDFIGIVYIESDVEILYDQVQRSIVATLLIISACASLALLLGFKYLRAVSDPINHLVDTANQVSRDRDYSLRATKYADDDLGELTEEFNDMLQQIQSRDAELQQEIGVRQQAEVSLQSAFDELELRVQERTVELSDANDQLQQSLQEKIVLLKEIHHRVKNNMQVVSSLLSLQTRDISSPRELEMFVNSQNRIKTMALIHEKLYHSDDLARVDFSDYIPALVDDLFETYKISPQDIELEVEVSDVLLDLDQAIPCGLMLNELISNSLKYAFPNGRKGKISVQLGPNKKGDTRLVVQDNGIGLPEGFDYRKSKSLGLQLISILSRQLQGGIELRSEAGTAFAITFPVRSGPMGDRL